MFDIRSSRIMGYDELPANIYIQSVKVHCHSLAES